jgi:hypothetical protein
VVSGDIVNRDVVNVPPVLPGFMKAMTIVSATARGGEGENS